MRASYFITLPFRYIEYQFNRVHPLWCTFAITENCNACCEYCQYWRKKHSDLPTESVLKVIDRLKELGIASVAFSGGECLLRPDIIDIVSYTVKSGIQASLSSNGLICNDELFHDLMSQGLHTLAFSLDGSNAAIHEVFRKGCDFDRVICSIQKAIEIKKKYQFTTNIVTATVVNKININDLQNIYRLRKSLGVDKNYFQPIWSIFGEKHFDEQFGFSEMTLKDLQKTAEELSNIPNGNLTKYYEIIPYLYKNFEWIPRRYKCYAGRAFVYVDSSGNLFPCSLLINQPMGSLLEENIQDVLSMPGLKSKLKNYKRFKCGGCTMSCYMEKNILLSGIHNPFSLWKRAR